VPGYLPGEKPKNEAGQMMLAAARIKAEATARHYPSGDWAFAERIEARVRTKELPSCRTEIIALSIRSSSRITSPPMPAVTV
jgi:hypothetical protein